MLNNNDWSNSDHIHSMIKIAKEFFNIDLNI